MTFCKHCSIDSATLKWQAERIEQLEEVERAAQERIRELLRSMSAPARHDHLVSPGWQEMSGAEAAVFSTLVRCVEGASYEQLYESYKHAPRNRTNFDTDPVKRTVHVLVYRIRDKVAPLGIEILTVHGWGYRITRAHRAEAAQAA